MPQKQPCPICSTLMDPRGLDGHRRLVHMPMRRSHETTHENSREIRGTFHGSGPTAEFRHEYRLLENEAGTRNLDPAPSPGGLALASPRASPPGPWGEAPEALTATFPLDLVMARLFDRVRESRPGEWNEDRPWSTAYVMFIQTVARAYCTEAASPVELEEIVSGQP